MSGELWTEVHNIVEEALTKTIPEKKKCKKAKRSYEEALQITRREEKWKEGRKIWVKLFNPSRLHLIYSYIMTHYHETWIPHLYIQTSYLVLFLRVICITFTITLWDTIFICNLQLRMEQQTGSKLEKEYIKAVYHHPAYLTYLQSTSWEMLGWIKHKLESRLLGEISITSDM